MRSSRRLKLVFAFSFPLVCVLAFTLLSSTRLTTHAAGTSSKPAAKTINSSTCGSWSVVPGANIGQSNELLGVAAISTSDVWAVGSTTLDTLAEHWNGSSWSIVTTPHTSFGYLNAVAAISTNDVWAVGYYSSQSGQTGLIEHWDGSAWSVVTSPAPANQEGYSLRGVAAVSTNDIWAVGYYTDKKTVHNRTFAEHWDGTSWNIVSTPDSGQPRQILYAVTAISTNDVWAVGENQLATLTEHWNGTAWSIVSSPNKDSQHQNVLYGVTHVPGTKVVWAVGNIYGYRNRTLAERWNGTAWSLVSTPNVNSNPKIYNVLQAVTAISSGNIWAVGYTGPGFGAGQTLIEHRNGSGWSVVSSPSPGGYDSDTLDAITEIAGSGQLLAVGTYQDSQTTSKVIIESYC